MKYHEPSTAKPWRKHAFVNGSLQFPLACAICGRVRDHQNHDVQKEEKCSN